MIRTTAVDTTTRLAEYFAGICHLVPYDVTEKGDTMDLDDVILELYRLAESRTWDGKVSDEALHAAIEGMEHIWELKQADLRKNAMVNANKKQPRIWC
jgi:hypothetical protein